MDANGIQMVMVPNRNTVCSGKPTKEIHGGKNRILDVAGNIGVSTVDLYTHDIRNRSLATDTVFYGAGVSPSVEYMICLNSVLNIVSGISFQVV